MRHLEPQRRALLELGCALRPPLLARAAQRAAHPRELDARGRGPRRPAAARRSPRTARGSRPTPRGGRASGMRGLRPRALVR